MLEFSNQTIGSPDPGSESIAAKFFRLRRLAHVDSVVQIGNPNRGEIWIFRSSHNVNVEEESLRRIATFQLSADRIFHLRIPKQASTSVPGTHIPIAHNTVVYR